MNVNWIKINIDMFSNPKIKYIRTLPDGNDILLTWIMLLTAAGRCNDRGYIYLTENVPYSPEMLSSEFGLPINTIKLAIETFKKLNMIDVDEVGIAVLGWEDHQNIDGLEKIREQTRKRVQEHRTRKKQELLPPLSQEKENCNTGCNVTVTDSNATEVEVDKEIDIYTTTNTISDTEVKTSTYTYKDIRQLYSTLIQGGASYSMTPKFKDDMDFYTDKLGYDVIAYAIQDVAAMGDLKNNHSYLNTVLMRYVEHGLDTVDKVKHDKLRYEASKNTKKNNTKPSCRKESSFNIDHAEYASRNNYSDLEKQLTAWQHQEKAE